MDFYNPRTLEEKIDDILFLLCNAVYKTKIKKEMDERFYASFPKTGDYGITEKLIVITLTPIAYKLCCALLLIGIWPVINKVLWKNQNSFRRNRSSTSKILTIRVIWEIICAINLDAASLRIDFLKASISIHWEKRDQILNSSNKLP